MKSKDIILGSGVVGTALSEQMTERNAPHTLVSMNDEQSLLSAIEDVYKTLYVCAAPGTKWRANAQPRTDKRRINKVIDVVTQIKCNDIVLISTIDVRSNEPYGSNRLYLERHLRLLSQLQGTRLRIVRLPMLIGRQIQKNVYYDATHPDPHDLIVESRDKIEKCKSAAKELGFEDTFIGMQYLTHADKRFVVFELDNLYDELLKCKDEITLLWTIENITAWELVERALKERSIEPSKSSSSQAYRSITRRVYGQCNDHYTL